MPSLRMRERATVVDVLTFRAIDAVLEVMASSAPVNFPPSPVIVGVTPAAGAGWSQRFMFTNAASDGSDAIEGVLVNVSTSASRHECSVSYNGAATRPDRSARCV